MRENKKLLIINYYYPPMNNGGVQRTYNFKKFLPRYGYDVSIITNSSYGRMENDDKNEVFRFPDWGYEYTHSSKGITVLKNAFRAFRKMQVYTGLITDGKYYWKTEVLKGLDEIFRSHQFNAVLASYPTPVNLELGEIIHQRYNVPLIVDYRDGLMYEPFPEILQFSRHFQKRLISLEKRMADAAVLQLTVNEEMNEYYTKEYPQTKSVVITNGFDDEEEINREPVALPEGINVLYTGSIGKSRKIYSFDELSIFFNRLFSGFPDFNFVFIGEYESEEKRLFSMYKNVYVFEKTDRNTVLATQKKADALLLISGEKGFTSGKFYEYLFAGEPVLNIGGQAGVGKIINGKDFGITCAPDDRDEIKRFFDGLKKKSLHFSRGEIASYTRRLQCKKFAEELDKILEP